MTSAASVAHAPIIIMEDKSDSAKKLKQQLIHWRPDVRICESIEEVRQIAASAQAGGFVDMVFVLDVHMGENREREGLDAIKELDTLRQEKKLSFYIAALSSHSECEIEAAERGADVFLLKESHPTDALELQTRVDVRDAERLSVQAHAARDRLAEREYKHLKRRLHNIKEGRTEYLSNAAGAINRALNWPLLTTADQMALSVMNGPIMTAEKEGHMDPVVVDLCIAGVDLLLRHASESEVAEWATRMRKGRSDVLVPWLRSGDTRILDDWDL